MGYKTLGQESPSAATDTTLYTASGEVVGSTLTVCNTNSTPVTYRIAVRVGGASIATKHYIAYETELLAYTTHTWTIGPTIDNTDVITVRASATGVAFNLFGHEI